MVKPIDAFYMKKEGKAQCIACGKAVSDQGLAKVMHKFKCKGSKK